ncbi:MAG: ComF family protein [Limosilactobacillus sp.]|uniref:ComF family protein n=1 Tax=Limosilactobacillus sp. TaxID=2773925 RepID=UPI002A74A7A4|nr:ComF family protein [Limosilactobacillus sp.]MDD7692991.1 ComF family protein [Lactobacillaceae bacterium]MDY2803496.1 ComF family protein [Limosilactobacillus sp.]
MNCLLCNARLPVRLSLGDLLALRPLERPVICEQCRAGFTRIDPARACSGCGRPQEHPHLCRECKQWQRRYGWHLNHQALYTYNDAMKEYMQRYKFLGDYRLRQVFTVELQQRIRQLQADLVVPIPVTTTTMATRGFNQVQGLIGDVTVAPLLRHRAVDKTAQSHKSRQQRLQTPQPFILSDPSTVHGKRILLVDDIYTTGRTLYHAAVLLKEAQCREIVSLSVAR